MTDGIFPAAEEMFFAACAIVAVLLVAADVTFETAALLGLDAALFVPEDAEVVVDLTAEAVDMPALAINMIIPSIENCNCATYSGGTPKYYPQAFNEL